MPEIVSSADAATRLQRAEDWLAARRGGALIVGASLDAARLVARRAAARVGAGFGWQATTLPRLAAALAAPALAARGRVAGAPLGLQAVVVRALHELRARGALGRLTPIADRPGLAAALLDTLGELRLAGVAPPSLRAALDAYARQLEDAGLADRADVLAAACARARPGPLLLLDVRVASEAEARLVAALAGPDTLATVPAADDATLRRLGAAAPASAPAGPFGRLAAALFDDRAGAAQADVVLLSAPGESRECVELARRIRLEAARGVRFDEMAVLLRAPTLYRTHLREALGRAGIPAHFAAGARRPDPAGRAFLSLLACAAEGLSARRFAEYLSLGEVPQPNAAPPWVAVDDEQAEEEPGDADAPTLATPRRWERLLVDAAVIGGRDRWERRLAGLEARARLALAGLDEPGGAEGNAQRRTLADLARLRAFALPLLDALAALPAAAAWGAWLAALEALAARALRRSEGVLKLLAELRPLADVGPVGLAEVRLVLRRRLADAAVAPPARAPGRVLVAPIDAARGQAFAVVLVPGLCEKVFPAKLGEDPLLPDTERRAVGLPAAAERLADERLLLRLAVGAATQRLYASFPRLDLEQGRARVPSLYALELVRAAEGRLPGANELSRRAELEGAAHAGWPAPPRPEDAIDEAEHDLSWLRAATARGAARYLVEANPHLAESLRARWRRGRRDRWTRADGLWDAGPEARAALARWAPAARPYSATALQRYATCPYQFYLYVVHRLALREVPEAIEEMDPLERGAMVHEVQFRLAAALRDAGLLPVTAERLAPALELLDGVLGEVAARWRDDLCPAIERVWVDGVAGVRADLREWLRRAAAETQWEPFRFELAFGLPGPGHDEHSRPDPVALDCGLTLRGSIDLVERRADGSLRATDHKTGRQRAKRGVVIGGGEVLQPVLYALALEKLFPDATVRAGRLYYCTRAGGFAAVETPLEEGARRAAGLVARTVGDAVAAGSFPAAPLPDACGRCDYLAVCGPEAQGREKPRLDALVQLRSTR